MPTYTVTEARRQLSKLIDKALRGEIVVITRRGKPVVELRATLGDAATTHRSATRSPSGS